MTDCHNTLSGKSIILLESLIKYYKTNIQAFTSIITQKSAISLRILDWLITNYAKKNNINYNIQINNETINFNIYLDYKNQLKAYSKKLFDPFCRRERIKINIQTLEWSIYNKNDIIKEDELITTVGQLNFFKWFIQNDIIKYAINNIQEIDLDMTSTLEESKQTNKRKELSKCASKTYIKCEQNTQITFN